MEEVREDPRGALVRPYAVTRGRTEPARDIAIEAILVTTSRGQQEPRSAGRDKHPIATMCDGRPQSLAEVAARMRMPLGVTRVLISDMTVDGLLSLPEATPDGNYDHRVARLERGPRGLRRL